MGEREGEGVSQGGERERGKERVRSIENER